MRQAMATADVGDDVFQEDPTVNRLEERVAEILGVEAALFVASGHMGNQLGLRVHGQGGDSVIAHHMSHIFVYESGAPSAISGLAPRFITTPDGTFTAADLRSVLMPVNIHHTRNRIVSIENTHNRCGGTVWPLEQFRSVCDFAHGEDMAVHLDGARLWNACIASGTTCPDWTGTVDSLSVCFSKGLGAPVGSAVGGSRAFIEEARFYRKMLGGQMRQAGIIAAGALYALEHNLERLAEDHANAQLMAEIIEEVPGLNCVWPATNILIVEITAPTISAPQLVDEMHKLDVLMFAMGESSIRLVTHLDVTRDECQTAAAQFRAAMETLTG